MVKEINLSQGQIALVDDEDYEWLNKNKWNVRFDPTIHGYYAKRTKYIGTFDGKKRYKTILMHREIMAKILKDTNELELLTNFLKTPPKYPVDHINHNTLENTRNNLRIVTSRQNTQNKKGKLTSNYPGVCWSDMANKWVVYIRINGKKIYLGSFIDERKAAKAYEKVNRKYNHEELVCKLKY